jgi:hypothetical protein
MGKKTRGSNWRTPEAHDPVQDVSRRYAMLGGPGADRGKASFWAETAQAVNSNVQLGSDASPAVPRSKPSSSA